ncbi:pilin [Patescibacteria group bacterium]|nr:pilin [Patescibacteria group bacterium]
MKPVVTFLCTSLLLIALVVLIFAPSATHAVTDFGLKNVTNLGLTNQKADVFVGNIIRWVLAALAVVLLAVMVYGGVTYATSAGSQERIELGKKIITYGVIGMVIVVAAFLIASYVTGALFSDPTETPVFTPNAATQNDPSSPTQNANQSSQSGNTGSGTLPSSGSGNTPENAQKQPGEQKAVLPLYALCGGECKDMTSEQCERYKRTFLVEGKTCHPNTRCLQPPNSPIKYCLLKENDKCSTSSISASETISNHGCVSPLTCEKQENVSLYDEILGGAADGICKQK